MAERVALGPRSVAGNIDANQIPRHGLDHRHAVAVRLAAGAAAARYSNSGNHGRYGRFRSDAHARGWCVRCGQRERHPESERGHVQLQQPPGEQRRPRRRLGPLARAISTGVTGLDRSHLVVAAGLHADSLRLEASGSVNGNATGALFGNDAELTALVVTQGAFRAGDRLRGFRRHRRTGCIDRLRRSSDLRRGFRLHHQRPVQ